jgi:hypothetical protein
MLTETRKAEIRRLIESIDEDGPSARAFGQLEGALAGCQESQRYYLRLMCLRANLQSLATELTSTAGGVVSDAPSVAIRQASSAPQRFRRRRLAGWSVCLLLVGTAIAWASLAVRQNRPAVAQITERREAWWEQQVHPGDRNDLEAGEWLSLTQGAVDIRFASGAEVTLKGPSRFQVLTSESLMLASGDLMAIVPPQAKGFTVKTPGPDIVDYGTQFAVTVPSIEQVDVHVRVGQVVVRSAQSSAFRGETRALHAGESVRVHVTRGTTEPLAFNDVLFSRQPGTEDILAIRFRPGQSGNQRYPGKLGTDFIVHRPILVTALGVFDSGGDGLKRPLTCEMWSRDPSGTPEDVSDDSGVKRLAVVEFTPAQPGEFSDGARTRNLPQGLRLEPGHYSVVAYGFGGREPNGNDYGRSAFAHAIAFSDSGGLVSYLGPGRFTAYEKHLKSFDADSFPTMTDRLPDGRSNFFAAGTFRFRAAEE